MLPCGAGPPTEPGWGTGVNPCSHEQIRWPVGLPGLVFASSQRLCKHFEGAEVLIFQDAAAVLSHS